MTITGSNLASATAVDFGGRRGDHRQRYGDADRGHGSGGPAGTVDVTVTTAGGTSATSSADQFTYAYGADCFGRQPGGRAVGGRHDGDDHRDEPGRAPRRWTSAAMPATIVSDSADADRGDGSGGHGGDRERDGDDGGRHVGDVVGRSVHLRGSARLFRASARSPGRWRAARR